MLILPAHRDRIDFEDSSAVTFMTCDSIRFIPLAEQGFRDSLFPATSSVAYWENDNTACSKQTVQTLLWLYFRGRLKAYSCPRCQNWSSLYRGPGPYVTKFRGAICYEISWGADIGSLDHPSLLSAFVFQPIPRKFGTQVENFVNMKFWK